MPAKRKASSKAESSTSTATIGFEAKLWLTADKLRNNMDAAETSGASKTAAGSPKGERGGAHQYFLTRFASADGKNGGQPSGARQTAKGSPQGERGGVHQFYTPSCLVRCLVEILDTYKGQIYDPACGPGGIFSYLQFLGRELCGKMSYPLERAH